MKECNFFVNEGLGHTYTRYEIDKWRSCTKFNGIRTDSSCSTVSSLGSMRGRGDRARILFSKKFHKDSIMWDVPLHLYAHVNIFEYSDTYERDVLHETESEA